MSGHPKTSPLADCLERALSQNKLSSTIIYPLKEEELIEEECCPLCGKTSLTIVSTVKSFDEQMIQETSVCNFCLFTFRSKSPSYRWFKKCWATISTGELTVFNPEVEKKRAERYREYVGWISKFKKSGTLLDIGAAYGTGSEVFSLSGYEVTALEPENDRANYIKNKLGLNCYDTPIQEFYPRQKWDVIVLSHCLEHLEKPLDVLKNVSRWMKENAILYVEVPDLWNFVDWNDALFLAHKSNFDSKNLRWLLESLGFEILEIFNVQDIEVGGMAIGFLSKWTGTPATDLPLPQRSQDENVGAIVQLYNPDPANKKMKDTKRGYEYKIPFINNFYHTIRRDMGTFKNIKNSENSMVFDVITSTEKLTDKS